MSMAKKAVLPDLIPQSMSPELEAWLVANNPGQRRQLARRTDSARDRVNTSLRDLAIHNGWPMSQHVEEDGSLSIVIIGETDDTTISC